MSLQFTEQEKKLMDQVSADYLMDYTGNIAKYVRLSGSTEELESFRYIESKMKEFGLKTTLTFSDAYISLPLSAELTVGGVSYDCITASMSMPTPENGIEAPLLYLGSRDNLCNNNVAGKAVIFDGFTDRPAVQQAAELGAVACIFINGEHLHSMICSPVWGNPTPSTFSMIPRIHVVSIDRYAGARLKKQLEIDPVAHIVTRIDAGWRKIPTLVAEKRGLEEPDKFILFSGHVDSWYYGAMDNGSANAVMMEIGRIIAQTSPRRSLRIAFWSGHSHGRYAGSAHYMDDNFSDICQNCLIHVNIDSVGAKGAEIFTEGNIMPMTKPLVYQVIRHWTGKEFHGRPFGRGGDHSFWGAGVPSTFMSFSGQPFAHDEDDLDTNYMIKQFKNGPESSGFGWWWHSTEDTMDKIDKANLQRDAQLYLSHIFHYCNDRLFPLDLTAGVEELRGYLNGYIEKAGSLADLSSVSQALDRFAVAVSSVETICTKLTDADDPATYEKANKAVHEAARTIVRLGYVGISEFDHDLALDVSRLPLLSVVNKLSTVEDEAQFLMLQTELKRRTNQCVSILDAGSAAIKSCLVIPQE